MLLISSSLLEIAPQRRTLSLIKLVANERREFYLIGNFQFQLYLCANHTPAALARQVRIDIAALGSHRGSFKEECSMPFVDTSSLRVIERLPGWHGRYFHSPSMTFAHYDFVRGSSIHEHFHPQEELYEVIEGEPRENHRRRYPDRPTR